MKFTRGLMAFGCFLALCACSNMHSRSEVDALNEITPVGSPFTQFLAAEYRTFAGGQLDSHLDYPDALHFARKGLAAARGDVVLPEPITDWNLKPEHMEELGTARGRLLVALDKGAREIAPQAAATAQARFDCWIEEQEENWEIEDIQNCKTRFTDALDALEGQIKPADIKRPEGVPPELEKSMPPEDTTEPGTSPPPSAALPMKAMDAMYLVFFDFDSAKPGAGSDDILDAVAKEIKGRSLEAVEIIGHTDSAGPTPYNNRLSMKRGNAVRDALLKRGVDAALIKVEGRGEDRLLVKTPDGVREPANRRAEITFK